MTKRQTFAAAQPRSARGITALVLVLSVAAAMLAVPQRAQAAVRCGSKARHWAVRDGSVGTRVGWLELRIEVCTNRTGITQTTASVTSDETGPGVAAGFKLQMQSPYRTSLNTGGFSGGSAAYRSQGRLRDCLPFHLINVCSLSEDFRVGGKVTMLNALNTRATKANQIVVNGRVFEFHWSWRCLNSACGVRLF